MISSTLLRPVRLAPYANALPAWRPAPAPAPAPEMGQSASAIAAVGAIPLLLSAAIGAGAAWVGFSTGQREKGFLKILGYGVGAFGALGAVTGVLGTILLIGGAAIADTTPKYPVV